MPHYILEVWVGVVVGGKDLADPEQSLQVASDVVTHKLRRIPEITELGRGERGSNQTLLIDFISRLEPEELTSLLLQHDIDMHQLIEVDSLRV